MELSSGAITAAEGIGGEGQVVEGAEGVVEAGAHERFGKAWVKIHGTWRELRADVVLCCARYARDYKIGKQSALKGSQCYAWLGSGSSINSRAVG